MRSKRDRIRLAEAALEISPDCADAYSLLAEEKAKSVAEARSCYEEAVRAGRRALGERFEEYEGHFWGFHPTRPYMRARAGLAESLWRLGEREDALDHWREMLRLNPRDNQGIRYVLLGGLLESGQDDAAGELLDEYDDAAAAWLYDRALWTLLSRGEGAIADAALREAIEQNRHVPPYLLGRRKLPTRSPETIGWGDASEAKAYALDALPRWSAVGGAMDWLARVAGND